MTILAVKVLWMFCLCSTFISLAARWGTGLLDRHFEKLACDGMRLFSTLSVMQVNWDIIRYLVVMKALKRSFQGAVLILMVAAGAEAQTDPQWSRAPVNFDDFGSGDSILGDYDGDGDLDIFFTGNNGFGFGARLYENRGSADFVLVDRTLLEGSYITSLAWEDYDHDGDLDILATGGGVFGNRSHTPETQLLKYYPGFGYASTLGFGVPGLAGGEVHWVDVDNDLDLDIVVSGRDRRSQHLFYVYSNHEGGYFQAQRAPGYISGSLKPGDFNRDGYIDLFMTGRNSWFTHAMVLRNDRRGRFDFVDIPIVEYYQGDATWIDFDRDGWLDLLTMGGADVSVGVAWMENLQGREFARVFHNEFIPLSRGSIGVGDLNGDDAPDVVYNGLGSEGRPLTLVYYNSPSGFRAATDHGLPNLSQGSVNLGDLDGDGDLDVFMTGLDGNGFAQTALYLNGTSVPADPPPSPTNLRSEILHAGTVRLSWSSPSGDSDLTYDVFLGYGYGDYRLTPSRVYVGDTTRRRVALPGRLVVSTVDLNSLAPGSTYYWAVQAVNTRLQGSPLSHGDSFSFDLSVDSDILAYRVEGQGGKTVISSDELGNRVEVFGVLTGDSAWAFFLLSPGATAYVGGVRQESGVSLNAYSGPVVYRVVASNAIHEKEWVVNRRPPIPLEHAIIELPQLHLFSSAHWGDYNADGLPDILFVKTGRPGSSPDPTVFLMQNQGFSFLTVDHPFAHVSGGAAAWGDYDQDGLLDLALTGVVSAGPVLSGSDAVFHIYRNTGGGNFEQQDASGLLPSWYGSIDWGDYDRDGDLDLLQTGETDYGFPVTRVYRNDAEGTFTFMEQFRFPGASDGQARWGDYNADGLLDMAVMGGDGQVRFHVNVYKRLQDGGFQNIFTNRFGSVPRRVEFLWEDFDSDGDLDILMNGNNGFAPFEPRYFLNQGDVFSRTSVPAFFDLNESNTAAGDLDNDGSLDLIFLGESLYTNWTQVVNVFNFIEGSGFLWQDARPLAGVRNGRVSMCDYDADEDLDVLTIGGFKANDWVTLDTDSDSSVEVPPALFNNKAQVPNTPPQPPSGLRSSIVQARVTLSWAAASDSETSTAGLSYALLLGSQPGSYDLATSNVDGSNERRLLSEGGKIQGTQAFVENLQAGTYFWAVQAVDTSRRGSLLSREAQFTVPASRDAEFLSFDVAGLHSYFRLDPSDQSIEMHANISLPYSFTPEFSLSTGAVASMNGVVQVSGSSLVTLVDGTATYSVVSEAGDEHGWNLKVVFPEMGLWELPFSGLPSMTGGDLIFGDLDLDKDLDLIIAGTLGETSGTGDRTPVLATRVYVNEGSGAFRWDEGILLRPLESSFLDLGDFDLDGDLDLLQVGLDGDGELKILVYENQRDGMAVVVERLVSQVAPHDCQWIDTDLDGDLDIFVSGEDLSGAGGNRQGGDVVFYSSYFLNDGTRDFVESSPPQLPGVDGTVSYGDFNADGVVDQFVTGSDNTGLKVFLREGRSQTHFEVVTGQNFEPMVRARSAWGDMDNDGLMDIMATGITILGPRFYVYLNGADHLFERSTYPELPRVWGGVFAPGDIDGDGDLDLVLSGVSEGGASSGGVYENLYGETRVNSPPSPPQNVRAQVVDETVLIHWEASWDDYTPSSGITYNLLLGAVSGEYGLTPATTFSDGTLVQAKPGTISQTNRALQGLSPGTYYYWVQAVDASFQGSPFETEYTFTVPGAPGIILRGNTIREGLGALTLIGSFSLSTQSDEGAILILEDGAFDNDDFILRDLSLLSLKPFDFDEKEQYKILVSLFIWGEKTLRDIFSHLRDRGQLRPLRHLA